MRKMRRTSTIVLGGALAFSALPAAGQTPAFEVATVKPADPSRPIAIRHSGNHIATVSTSLQFLIAWAYDMHSERLYGKPRWLDTVSYDVLANAPEGETADLRRMMQSLLAERFKLAVHREKRELPMYELVVAKDGPKVKVAPHEGDWTQNPFQSTGLGRIVGTQVTATMVCKFLGDQLGRSVVDKTGLDGVFDFKLEWAPEGWSPNAMMAPRPSLFTALQEQLGFRLEARKGPVEVLVIDRVESTPTEN